MFCEETLTVALLARLGGTVSVTHRLAVSVPPVEEAEIVTAVGPGGNVVFTGKVALAAPPGTVTVDGTVATAVLPLESVTTTPPAGAAFTRVTVPVDVAPPTTDVGFRVREDRAPGAVTVSVAVCVRPPEEALIVTGVEVETVEVVTVKVTLVAPAARLTLVGTVATEVLLLDSVIKAPPDGAPALKVTVPAEVLVPTTVLGLKLSEARVPGGVTVRVAVGSAAPYEAAIVTEVETDTVFVYTMKVALDEPAGMVTFVGTVATAELVLDNDISAPPEGAAPFSVTVPVVDVVPTTDVGLNASEDKVAGGVTIRVML